MPRTINIYMRKAPNVYNVQPIYLSFDGRLNVDLGFSILYGTVVHKMSAKKNSLLMTLARKNVLEEARE